MRTRERLTPRRIPRVFKVHQKDVDQIVGEVRKVLDPLWDIAKETDDQMPWHVFRDLLDDRTVDLVADRVTSLNGACYLGCGSDRIVFRIASEWVVKVSLDNAGCPATVSECHRWRHASSTEARHLLPTLAAHPKGLWSVMPYASEVGTEVGKIPARYLENYGDPHNWGLWRGRRVLLDYAE